jgi:hypothetical protein
MLKLTKSQYNQVKGQIGRGMFEEYKLVKTKNHHYLIKR